MFTQPFKRSVRIGGAAVPVLFLFLAACFLAGCSEEKSTEPTIENPSGVLISASDCKNLAGAKLVDQVQPDQDCMEYSYENNTLLLTHVNAGFNCCTDPAADITIEGNVMTITESESGEYCDCLCLVDLGLKITDLPPGEYTIKVVEMYLEDGDQLMEFTVDLTESPSGDFCVQRTHYPWGVYGKPAGSLVEYRGCKEFGMDGGSYDIPDELNCLEYDYDGAGFLQMTHINGRFNCCPEELLADISVNDSIITIVESERLDDGCFCLCLYDLDYEIENLPPGYYTVKVIEPHILLGEDALEFLMVLECDTSGIYCVDRAE